MRQNFIKLLKTHVEKMSVFCLAIILMKTSRLYSACHYLYENKGEINLTRVEKSVNWRRRQLNLLSFWGSLIRPKQALS
jgi:hypothetical protein